MKLVTIDRAMTDVNLAAESIRRGEPQRFPEAASPGDALRQGDLIVTLLDRLPSGAKEVGEPQLQLADGSTQGSRHCLDSPDGVRMYEVADKGAYDGPILDLSRERTITHPEHGHMVLPPGCYAVTYQRTVDSEQREARVRD